MRFVESAFKNKIVNVKIKAPKIGKRLEKNDIQTMKTMQTLSDINYAN